MILGSIQPSYLAWIPFFARMAVSDSFVFLDDVEYSKNSFHNRNKIRTLKDALLLTVPVLYKGNSKAKLCEIQPDYKQNWQVKHLKSIQMCYQKAPYFQELNTFLEFYYNTKWDSLADLNITFIDHLAQYIGLKVPCYRSSLLHIEQEGNYKLVELCRQLKADSFIVKPGTEEYHPRQFFNDRQINFAYFTFNATPYPQCSKNFIPYLSILDFAMYLGKNSKDQLIKMASLMS